VGEVHFERKDFQKAGEQFALALALFESMAAADRNNVDARLGVGMTHQNLGSVAASSGRPDAALRDFEAARALYEPLVAADPTNAWTAGLLAELYLAIGEAEEKLDGGMTRACGAYRRSSEAFRKLRAADRLQPIRAESSGRAEQMAARCRDAG
jgi:tetratricopeptide (TPR) repeat protein